MSVYSFLWSKVLRHVVPVGLSLQCLRTHPQLPYRPAWWVEPWEPWASNHQKKAERDRTSTIINGPYNYNTLQLVFKSVLLGKTAVGAWWGYTTATDKQRLEALIRRAVRVGLYTQQPDQTCTSWSVTWMMLFLHEYRRMNIMYYNNCYLPVPAKCTLNIKTDYDDRNFITRLLYKDTFSVYLIVFLLFFLFHHIV